MARNDLSNRERALIGVLPLLERGRKAHPAHDSQRSLDGMLHVLRVGCPWRNMHERQGKLNSVDVRFRERGVWDARLEMLVKLGLTDNWQHPMLSGRSASCLKSRSKKTSGDVQQTMSD